MDCGEKYLCGVNGADSADAPDFSAETGSGHLKIADVYAANRFNLFVSYCTGCGFENISDLAGFDFYSLSSVHGIGAGKIKSIIEVYENCISAFPAVAGNEICEDNIKVTEETVFSEISSDFAETDISFLFSFSIKQHATDVLRANGVNTIGDLGSFPLDRARRIIGIRNTEKLISIREGIKKSLPGLLYDYLESHMGDSEYEFEKPGGAFS